MFKKSLTIVGKRTFIVHKVVTKSCPYPTFVGIQFSNIATDSIVTNYLVLPVDIRYNDFIIPVELLTNVGKLLVTL